MFKKVDVRQSLPKMEEEVLKYWEDNNVFEKSVSNRADAPVYSFYDGPPFATGLPHYGHIVGQTLKDAVPRYWTMRGFQVERKWGWDCHGLPIENIAEKAMGVKRKKDIEEMGVDKFNEFCRSTVLEYTEEWKKVTMRLGRWADREHAYKTMDKDYMESVWWVFKQLWDKGLVYESYRTMHVCTRCETTLSQSEVSEGYMDVKDLSVVAKFELVPKYPKGEQIKNCRLIITDEQGRILMGREKKHGNVYGFPGGHLKIGEKWKDAAKREAKEEMGVDIEVVDAKLASFWVDGKVRATMTARIIGGEISETEDFGGFVWYTPQEIEEKKVNFIRYSKLAWETYIHGENISFEDLEKAEPLKTSILAWTTTPWTLPGNVALAVGEDIEYVRVKVENEFFICAKNLIERVFAGKEYLIDATFLGKELIGTKYLPPFDAYYKNEGLENHANGWKIYGAEFVTTEDGTGVVHIAPAFGEDDMNLGKAEKLPFAQHVGMDGIIKDEVKELAGLSVKPKENPQSTDVEVIKYLAGKGLLFAKEKYEHSYPHCWRCDTPLINYATSSWFVKVLGVKDKALETAKEINWSPEHIKSGRFGKWLEGARDWSISRQRFWASVIPVWKCDQCAMTRVFGSVKELEDTSGEKIEDLHKHIVDKIVFQCTNCDGSMKRIPDVLDTWFDSGSMPYAQMHYPFENKEKFEASFPAKFIAEGIDQTRAWFYYLHVLGAAIMEKPAFQNVIVNGIVQAEDGKKMAKRLNNYPDPMLMFEKHGADAMRLYLLSSPIVAAENLNFSEKDMSEISRNVFRMLWNSYSFFVMYADIDGWIPSSSPQMRGGLRRGVETNILDKWMLSELQLLIKEVNGYMESYDIMRATRSFSPFVDNLSNWYIRRSRKRFWKSEDDGDKENAYQTLYTVLVTLAKLMAPFTPFIAEEIYRNLMGLCHPKSNDCHPELVSGSRENGEMLNPPAGGQHDNIVESVHLTDYPVTDESLIDEKLNEDMRITRNLVTEGLQLRAQEKIKVRQPLSESTINNQELNEAFFEILKDELNVKKVVVRADQEVSIVLDIAITPELKLEGQAREIIRFIQETRKEAGFEVDDRIEAGYHGFETVFDNPELNKLITKEVLAEKGLHSGEIADADVVKETTIEDIKISLWLKR